MMQVTVARISGYGPWTLTLGYDREHRLQMLQASIYQEVQQLFSDRGALVFPNRYDEYIVSSSGVDSAQHSDILDTLVKKFTVGFTMHAGRGTTPHLAEKEAHLLRSLNPAENNPDDVITVLHMDVDNLTGKTSQMSPYEITNIMLKLYCTMSEYFLKRESFSFFMGGDNFMILASEQGKTDSGAFLDEIRQKMGITLNCGVGIASTGRQAAMRATKSLDTIRDIRESGAEKIPRIYEINC